MKGITILIVILLLPLLVPFVQGYALDYDCVARTPACNPDEVTVISLENTVNAQGALPTFPNAYPTVICCKGTGLDNQCGVPFSSVITRLEQARNSHAQERIIMAPLYSNEICLNSITTFECTYDSVCAIYQKCVVELSNDRNAHLAACRLGDSGYIKVCCGFQAYCGNGIVEPGEECDWSAPDAFGRVQNCTLLDTFSNNNADLLFCGDTCFFNTTDCEKNNPQDAFCGNGIIDINETCDFKDLTTIPPIEDWGRNITGCHWFDTWMGGNLSCIPPGEEYACHFNTTACLPGTIPTNMTCGRVFHDNPDVSTLLTVACNDTRYPKDPPPPEFLCPDEFSCLYAYETEDYPDPFPLCVPDGGTWRNLADLNITCFGKDSLGNPLNTWCPENFVWDEGTQYCVFEDPVADSGKMYNPFPDYEANCSLPLREWVYNYSLGNRCLGPEDEDGWPDDQYPKNVSACINFTVANYNDTVNYLRPYGLYSNNSIIVY